MPVNKPEVLYLGKQFLNKFPALRTPLAPVLGLRSIFKKNYLKRRVVEKSLDALFVEPVKLKVDEFQGFFFINPRSDLFKRLILNGFYEPILSKICRRLIDTFLLVYWLFYCSQRSIHQKKSVCNRTHGARTYSIKRQHKSKLCRGSCNSDPNGCFGYSRRSRNECRSRQRRVFQCFGDMSSICKRRGD